MSLRRLSAVVVSVWLVLGESLPCGAQATRKIDMAPEVQHTVEQALEHSAIIRSQWSRISDADNVMVYIHVLSEPFAADMRARTRVRKYTSGFLLAIVEIPSGEESVELLAHELEHVLEQIEGVNLRVLACTNPTAAWRRRDGAYETARAQQVGLAAALEAAGFGIRD